MANKAEALKVKVQKTIDNSEYRSVKMLGISCSRSDLEMIVFILDIFLKQGNINGFAVYGNSREVIEKAGINLN